MLMGFGRVRTISFGLDIISRLPFLAHRPMIELQMGGSVNSPCWMLGATEAADFLNDPHQNATPLDAKQDADNRVDDSVNRISAPPGPGAFVAMWDRTNGGFAVEKQSNFPATDRREDKIAYLLELLRV